MIDNSLFYYNLDVTSKEALFQEIGGQLIESGFVKDNYIEELLKREQDFPTGLPLKIGVAIPHTSHEFVNTNRLVFVKPQQALRFQEMGNNEHEIAVELIIFLVIQNSGNHLNILNRIVESIQDETFLRKVVATQNSDEFKKRILEKFAIYLGGDTL